MDGNRNKPPSDAVLVAVVAIVVILVTLGLTVWSR